METQKSLNFKPLIKKARAGVKVIQKGKIAGSGANISIVLLADKYNKTFNSTDSSINISLKDNNELSNDDKVMFENIFKSYKKIPKYLKKSKNYQKTLVNVREYQSLIYLYTISLLYKFEYLIKSKSAKATAKAKNNIQKKIKEIWILSGKKRTMEEATRLKKELEKINIKRKVETIFGWICKW